MTSVKHFLYRHRVYFFLVVFLLAYEFLVGGCLMPWRMNDHVFSLYALDFDLGFCSEILPGAVFRFLFHGSTDERLAAFYAGTLLVLFFLLLCALLEQLILHTPQKDRPLCFFFCLLFLTGPASFSFFVISLGVFDFYWALFALLFIVFLSKKQFWFFIPLLFVLCVFVHYASVICYIPFMAILLLYRISLLEKKMEKTILWIVFSASVILTVICTLYSLFLEQDHLNYTMQEFDDILKARGVKSTIYLDYEFYKYLAPELGLTADPSLSDPSVPVLLRLVRFVKAQWDITVVGSFKNGLPHEIAYAVLALLPIVAALFTAIWSILRDRENRCFLRKLSILLIPALFFLTLFGGMFFSTDTFRWLSHTVIPFMAAVFYIAYCENGLVWSVLKKKFSFISPAMLVIYFCLFAALAPSK